MVVGKAWVVVLGIKASRLMVAREKKYGYIDGTPRIMTIKEQTATFGEVDTKNIVVITTLISSGNTYPGYGRYPKDQTPLGVDKGNSKFNMASMRSERQALDRLSPGTLPTGTEVGDERYVDIEATTSKPIDTASGPVDQDTGEIIEGEARVLPDANDPDNIFSQPPEPTPEPEPKAKAKPEPKKADRLVNAGEIATIHSTLAYSNLTLSDISAFVASQNWRVKKLSELKLSQQVELLAAIKSGAATAK